VDHRVVVKPRFESSGYGGIAASSRNILALLLRLRRIGGISYEAGAVACGGLSYLIGWPTVWLSLAGGLSGTLVVDKWHSAVTALQVASFYIL
jgi:hypothetical protein